MAAQGIGGRYKELIFKRLLFNVASACIQGRLPDTCQISSAFVAKSRRWRYGDASIAGMPNRDLRAVQAYRNALRAERLAEGAEAPGDAGAAVPAMAAVVERIAEYAIPVALDHGLAAAGT